MLTHGLTGTRGVSLVFSADCLAYWAACSFEVLLAKLSRTISGIVHLALARGQGP